MFSIAIYINLPFLLFFPTPWVSQWLSAVQDFSTGLSSLSSFGLNWKLRARDEEAGDAPPLNKSID